MCFQMFNLVYQGLYYNITHLFFGQHQKMYINALQTLKRPCIRYKVYVHDKEFVYIYLKRDVFKLNATFCLLLEYEWRDHSVFFIMQLGYITILLLTK